MEFESEVPPSSPSPEVIELNQRQPLVLLRDTERSLRLSTLETLTPLLPERIAANLEQASTVADESLDQLAAIDVSRISDAELRPVRLQMGLLFVGFGALGVLFLMLYLQTLHPALTPAAQIRQYWHDYVWCVSLGIAGMFMLGREAMRPPLRS